ncbi:MAG: PQQ-binding-like beta-propeller repeat protein [Chlamydiota bacterium]
MAQRNFQTHSFCLFLLLLLVFSGTKLVCEEFQPKEIWRHFIGDQVKHGTYDQKNKLVFCGSKKKLYCLDNNGNRIWSYPTEGVVRGIAYDSETERVFCGSSDGSFRCISYEGKLCWKINIGFINTVVYDYDSKKIICGGEDSYLYYLECNGGIIWKLKTGENAVNPVIQISYDPDNKRIFLGSYDHHLYCFNQNKEILWTHKADKLIGGVAYDSKNKLIFCGSWDSKLYCLNYSGGILWEYKTKDRITSVIYDHEARKVFCLSFDNYIYCLDIKGNCIWKYPFNKITKTWGLGIDVIDQVIFVSSNKGIGAIKYGEPIESNPSPPPEQPADIDKVLEELETCREKHSAETIEKLQVVVDTCPESFSHSICTPISKGFIFSIQEEDIQGKSHHVLYKTDPYMKKEPIKYFLPIFSPISPLLIDKKDDIYFVSKNREIFCYTQEQEFVLFDKYKYTSPSIGESGLLYFSSKEGHLFCADPETKGIIWKQKVESKEIWPSPAIDEDGNAYFADKFTLYTVSMTGKLTQKTLTVPANSPLKIGTQGNLYFLSDPSTLTSIEPNGDFRWNYRVYDFSGVKSPSITSPAFDLDGNVYVGSSEGKIYCIDRENGSWVWQVTVNNDSPIHLSPTSNETGEVFFLAEDGALYRKRNRGFFEKAPFNWFKF